MMRRYWDTCIKARPGRRRSQKSVAETVFFLSPNAKIGGVAVFANLCSVTMSIRGLNLLELIALAKTNHFGGIDLPAEALQSEEAASSAARTMADAGLEWGIFWLPADFSSCSDSQYRDAMRILHKVLPLVQLAGCTRCYNHIWPGSKDKTYLANFRFHASRLKALADLLGRYGVTLGLEFIGAKTLRDDFKYPFVHTLAEALELADAVDPTVGIVLDMYHLYTSGGCIEDLRQTLPADRIVNIHANDAPLGRAREEQMDMEREMPLATGVIDAPGIVRWLKEVGYSGPVIAEPFAPTNARFAAMPPEAVAQEVGECMTRLLGCCSEKVLLAARKPIY